VRRIYGTVTWLVYSCSDRASLVIVSDEGSPAMPFYFMLSPQGGAYRLSGEGTGKKEATAAAFEDLGKLGPADIEDLITETQHR